MKSLFPVLLVSAALAACSQSQPGHFAVPPVSALPDNSLPVAANQSNPAAGQKWLWLMSNLNDDPRLAENIALVERAARAGYTHLLVCDVKFMKWDYMGDHYTQNVRKLVQACHDKHMQFWITCAPLGYANELLMRDPNLAEGLPVKDAEFLVEGLRLKPIDPDLKLINGDFTMQAEHAAPAGWQSPAFGRTVFIDTKVTYNNKPSLRIDSAPPASDVSPEAAAARETSSAAAVIQTIAVKPFHYYHVHAMLKTEGRDLKRGTQIEVIAENPDKTSPDKSVRLNYQTPVIAATTDWQNFDMTFNSLEFSSVTLKLPGRQSRRGGGTGSQGAGTAWWADVKIEPGAFVNLVRRAGAPLTITSPDKKITYAEGKDVYPVVDPLLGYGPQAGHFEIWHTPPVIGIPQGSRLHENDHVLISYYHTELIHSDQAMCCMSEPKTMQLIAQQIHEAQTRINPDGYFMSYDELRLQGYDKSCEDRHLSMAQILADNVAQTVNILHKEAPGKPIAVWSDLFDPFHNAKPDGKRYYLVKGVSPWYGAWQGLPKDVIIMNWHGHDENRIAAMKFFADQGYTQILSAYYDHDISAFLPRLEEATHIKNIAGTMYTTWNNDFTQMEPFAEMLKKHAGQ